MEESKIRSMIFLIRLKAQAACDILKSLDDLIEIREKEGMSYKDGKDGLANGAEIILNEAVENIKNLKNMFLQDPIEEITHKDAQWVMEESEDVKSLLKVKKKEGGE